MTTNNSSNYKPTQYNLQVGGANGTLQDVGTGTSGQVLTSAGPSAAPTWSPISPSVYFKATRTTNLSNVTGDGTELSPMIFDNVITNVGSAYNPSSGVFYAATAGLYMFSVGIAYTGITSSHTSEKLSLWNSSTVDIAAHVTRNPYPIYNVTLSSLGIQHSGIIYCNADNFIRVTWNISGGTKVITLMPGQTYFAGYKIGE